MTNNEVTITFTSEELQALAGLLDAGVRASGLRSVKEAAVLLIKLENATQPVQKDLDNGTN
jgi:hypothetical protein